MLFETMVLMSCRQPSQSRVKSQIKISINVSKLLVEVKIGSLQTEKGFRTVKCLNRGDFIIIKLLTQLNKGTSCRRACSCSCPINQDLKRYTNHSFVLLLNREDVLLFFFLFEVNAT